jgi:uncharacterized protein (TIGR03435 family)
MQHLSLNQWHRLGVKRRNSLEAAYNVSEDNLTGGPAWLGSELFDVIAKVPAGTTQSDCEAHVEVAA